MNRTIQWLVHTADPDGVPGPYIPTMGNATSASDLFRVAALHQTGHEGWNSCYADVASCVGLARLIEGELHGYADLVAAELALQVLLWHDRVDILIPGLKARVSEGGGGRSYIRCEDPRSELAFDLFRPLVPFDQIFALEEVRVEDSTVKDSTLQNSEVVGLPLEEVRRSYLSLSPRQAAALSSIPLQMGVPAYFSDPRLKAFDDPRAFFGDLYSSIAAGWQETVEAVPDVEYSLQLPPLVAVVLDRAATRNGIPEAISDLREETAIARKELVGFSELVRGARTQKDIENRCKEIKASFEAVVPASRKRQASIILPFLKLWKVAKTPLDTLIHALNPDYQPEDARLLANRTVTGRTFAKLFATDSMHSLLTHFFTRAELKNLEKSLRP